MTQPTPRTDQAVVEDFPRIFAIALERFGTQGRQEHGDSLFAKSDAQVLQEEMEEILDELMYACERYRRLEARHEFHCRIARETEAATGSLPGPDGHP